MGPVEHEWCERMSDINNEFNDCRLLLYYKGDISALTLFAQQADGTVCFPEALPVLSSMLEEKRTVPNKIARHPSALVNAIGDCLELPTGLLLTESGFKEYIDTPGGVITVFMARFDRLDPPHSLMQAKGCVLKPLGSFRGRPPAELELLRRAYERVMES